jgi:hypothetical protein
MLKIGVWYRFWMRRWNAMPQTGRRNRPGRLGYGRDDKRLQTEYDTGRSESLGIRVVAIFIFVIFLWRVFLVS